MAIAIPSVVSAISGSIGGLVFAPNKGGVSIRARKTPVNPNTPQQQAVRTAMASLAVQWNNTLTPAERDAWETYAANVPIPNKIGSSILLSGISMYCRCNVPRIQAGLPQVDVAPTIYNIGDFSAPTFAYDSTNSEVDVTFVDTDDWVDEDDAAMLVYSSRQQAPSINFFKGPYRLAGSIAGDSVTPPTTPAAVTAPFPCAATNRCFVKVSVTRADGRLSAPFRGFGVGA